MFRHRPPLRRVIREIVYENGPFCQLCKIKFYHHAHHMDNDGTNNDPKNLFLVCRKCHEKIHHLW